MCDTWQRLSAAFIARSVGMRKKVMSPITSVILITTMHSIIESTGRQLRTR